MSLILAAVAALPISAAAVPDLTGLTIVAPASQGGSRIAAERMPQAVTTLGGDALRPGRGSAVLELLDRAAPAVGLSDAQANPYQPSLMYRGFEASPLQGVSQGLAIYVDGVRFNQPFGDTANWDLIPEAAIRSLTLQGSNPAFGLNALGGSLSVALKTGFSDPGGEVEASAGSFGRRSGQVSWGGAGEHLGLFVAATASREDGWRDFSPSRIRQFYSDVGWRKGGGEFHLGLLVADNDLTGNGSAPVELLAADRSAVFTHPDETRNRFALLRATGAHDLGATETLQAQAYLGRFRQESRNGDASDAEPCEDAPALLCLDDDGPLLTDAAGAPIGDFLGGGPYAQLNATATRTRSAGASVQLVSRRPVGTMASTLTVGAGFDRGRTQFAANSSLGALTADRGFGGPGVVIVQRDGPVAPVGLKTATDYLGLYAVEALDLTPSLTLTLSGRFNHAEIRLRDQIGAELNGDHRFRRLNPGAGLSWRFAPGWSAYAGYAQTTRAPTPAELSCADPESPCSLTNFFVADPPLEQVKAGTLELGVRTDRALAGGVTVRGGVGLFSADMRDDISLVASAFRGRGYFQNVGRTRRRGLEAHVSVGGQRWEAFAGYALTDAAFRSPLLLNAPDNPSADEDGRIAVEVGDRLPGVARHRLKLGGSYRLGRWRVSGNVVASSGAHMFGDEANLEPALEAYAVANLAAAWALSEAVELYLAVDNVTNARYETFGTFTATEEVALAEAPGAEDPRSLTPAAPRAVQLGVRLRF